MASPLTLGRAALALALTGAGCGNGTPTAPAPAPAAAPPAQAGSAALEVMRECLAYGTQKQWDKQITCANEKLRAADPVAAQAMIELATSEWNAKESLAKLESSLHDGDLDKAAVFLAQIPATSQYAARAHQELEVSPAPLAPSPPAAPPAGGACDFEAHRQRGTDATNRGEHANAVLEYEAALECKPGDLGLTARAYMESCMSNNPAKAKQYFARLPPTGSNSQQVLQQICVRSGIDMPLTRPSSAVDPAATSDAATSESNAERAASKMETALKSRNLAQARGYLDQIPATSQYMIEAQRTFDGARAREIEATRSNVAALVKNHACGELEPYLDGVEKRQGADVSAQFRATACTTTVATVPDPSPGSGSACDYEEHNQKGADATNKGEHAKALFEFEAALKCKPGDLGLTARVYMEACQANIPAKAKRYFSLLPATGSNSQQTLQQLCTRVGIDMPLTKH